MKPHEKAQKHSEDCQKTLNETCTVNNGFIQKWNGKEFFEKLGTLGHDFIDPKRCKCGAKEHYS